MKFLKEHKNVVILVLIVIGVLTGAFFMGESPDKEENISENVQAEKPEKPEAQESSVIDTENEDTVILKESEKKDEKLPETDPLKNEVKTDKDIAPSHETKENKTKNIPAEAEKKPVSKAENAVSAQSEVEKSIKAEEKPHTDKKDSLPPPVNKENSIVTDNKLTCTLSVRCDTALNNKDKLTEGKEKILPENGIIFPETEVEFYEGENVFNILLREMKKNRIHLEFVNTPVYNSAYIEGINNLYEFDCGELSGWMYRVNGIFPNYGCSRYVLNKGDKVEFLYTCDLGKDVGGEYASGNGRK